MNNATSVAFCCRTEGEGGQCSIPAPDETKRLLRTPGRNSALAMLVSLPWCCILPAVLSFLSLSGAVATRRLTWATALLIVAVWAPRLWAWIA